MMLNPFKKQASPQVAAQELGVGGVRVSSGYVHDEFITALVGERGRRVFREMSDNDAIVGAILFSIEMLVRSAKWTVFPNKKTQDQEAADFMTDVLADMDHSWEDFIATALSMLIYGWQYTEIVAKMRDDGQIGIRRLADRAQESLERWILDEFGNVVAMIQQDPNSGRQPIIPIWKALHFRPHMFKNSPEGRSVIRRAYRSYFFLKNIQEIEATAIERELNGLPVVQVPNEILKAATPATAAAKARYEKLVRDIKFNNQGGVVLPSDPFFDDEGNPTEIRQVSLRLLSSEGNRNIDTNPVIMRYQKDIARTVLADFIMLGATGAGSMALSKDKSKLFSLAVTGWVESIAAVTNKKLFPYIWELNGRDMATMPYIMPEKISIDISELGTFVKNISGAGFNLATDVDLENTLRDAANLPPKTNEVQLETEEPGPLMEAEDE